MRFGALVKKLRLEKQLTLRKFCLELHLDPSNWSKIERGVNSPPRDPDIILEWADFFEIEGEKRQEFVDAASVARQEIPADLVTDEELVAQLPAFFRAIRNTEPTSEKSLKEFVRDVQKTNSPDPITK